MLQPSAIPTSVSSELTESLQQTLSPERLRTLKALGISIPLPSSLRHFLFFVLAVGLVCTAMTMQILLSIQIWQTTAKVERLKAEYRTIEQQNTALVWEIAQKSTLENVQQRAAALGYSVALNRHYVAAPQPHALASLERSTTAATAVVSADQTTQAALQVGTADLVPETGFLKRLQGAGQAVTQWWQEQWQKVLRKS